MGWTSEQNTGIGDQVVRCIWFKGYVYAFTFTAGVWRRDGIGPWVQVFAGNGHGWYWEDDSALYCGAAGGLRDEIWRSEDGVVWVQDVDLSVAFPPQGSYNLRSEIGGYGSYLYVANHDVTGAGTTFFYRRDLAGVWTAFGATHAGAEGANGRGIIGFGSEVYWTNVTNARYWDGAAWSIEATLDAQLAEYMSVIDNKLYVSCNSIGSNIGGYYWKTTAATNWSWMNLPVPNNTWSCWALCEGADGETYTSTNAWPDKRVYRRVGGHLNLIGYESSAGLNWGGIGGVCTDATGAMFVGVRMAGTIQFFAFVGVYNVTASGGGLYPQSMDCDGDGDSLYIGLYDTTTAQPILISVPLPLDGATSTGNAMFQPGAGDAINVKCTDVGDNLVISGKFAANNENVETSDDAGLTWVDIDRDAWGADTAQPLIVAPLTVDEVMVAVVAVLQDIMETFDAGATAWIQNNAAIGFTPSAMVKLVNGTEMIIGDGAGVRIDYSPNRGATTADITGAFGGNVAALEIT